MTLSPDNPLISIFIPTYNRSSYLRECLESCLAQKFNDYEIVVGDDGSTDDTPRMMDEYVKQHPRIRYFRLEQNSRAMLVWSLARNARGEYLLRIGDDDRLCSDVLPIYAGLLKRCRADILYGDLYYVDGQGALQSRLHFRDYHLKRDLLLQDLLTGCVLPFPGSLVRTPHFWKTLVEDGYPGFPIFSYDVRGLIPSLAGKAIDYLDWVLLASGSVFKHIDAFSVYYRIHTGQDSVPAFKNGSEESFVQRMLLCLYGLKEIFPEGDWESSPELTEAQALLTIANNMCAMYDTHNAAHYYQRALVLSGRSGPLFERVFARFAACSFKSSAGIDPDLCRITGSSASGELTSLVDAYARAAAAINQRLAEALALEAKRQFAAAEALLLDLLKGELGRTAITYEALRDLYEMVEDWNKAYHHAIYAMALSGYSDGCCRRAMTIAARVGKEDECRTMVRRTFIQPWHLRNGRYFEEMLFAEDMAPLLAANMENDRTARYRL